MSKYRKEASHSNDTKWPGPSFFFSFFLFALAHVLLLGFKELFGPDTHSLGSWGAPGCAWPPWELGANGHRGCQAGEVGTTSPQALLP